MEDSCCCCRYLVSKQIPVIGSIPAVVYGCTSAENNGSADEPVNLGAYPERLKIDCWTDLSRKPVDLQDANPPPPLAAMIKILNANIIGNVKAIIKGVQEECAKTAEESGQPETASAIRQKIFIQENKAETARNGGK